MTEQTVQNLYANIGAYEAHLDRLFKEVNNAQNQEQADMLMSEYRYFAQERGKYVEHLKKSLPRENYLKVVNKLYFNNY